MPHYKDGTKAELFDEVLAEVSGRPVTGVVCQIHEGATSCNLTIATAMTRPFHKYDDAGVVTITHKIPLLVEVCCTARECERLDIHAKRVEAEKVLASAPPAPAP